MRIFPLANVLHITDPHLFADRKGELRGTVTFDSLNRVLEHVRASRWQPDLILLTGDLVQDDSEAAYEHFPPLLEGFGVPVLCLPGNHDIPDLMEKILGRPPFAYCESHDVDGWRIINVDSYKPGSAGGHVSDAELDRLARELASSATEHALVCLHHPPVPTGSAWLDTVGLDNRDEFLSVAAASGKVRAVLGGHVHQEIDTAAATDSGPLRVIATPSTCSQFKPKSKTFAVDDRPPAYRRIVLHRDGGFDSALVWVDEGGNAHD